MTNVDKHIREEISAAVAREAENGNTSARGIARALAIDTRTARRHMARLGIVQTRAPRAKKEEAALPKVPSPGVNMPLEPFLRDGAQAQRVLWELLEDPSAPPQSRVAAYNALAEAGAWSNAPQELPEPQNDSEAAERFVLLFESLSKDAQALVRKALGF